MKTDVEQSSSAGTDEPRFVRWREPQWGAFSLVVPEEWKVDGGVVDGGSEKRKWFRLRSPGGRAELRAVDPRLPLWFVEPSWSMSPFGAPWAMPGVPVRPCVAPEVFADEYVRGFAVERGDPGVTPERARTTEEILAEETDPEKNYKLRHLLQLGALLGGVDVSLRASGQMCRVDVLCLRMPSAMGVLWAPLVTAMAGPAESWREVSSTLRALAKSFTANPDFDRFVAENQRAHHEAVMSSIATNTAIATMRHQSAMEAIHAQGERARISADTNAAVSQLQFDAWRENSARQDEMHRRAVNAVRETVDVVDPSTGVIYTGAPAGFETYWTDSATHTVIATNTHENPQTGRFTEAIDLDRLPRSRR